MAGKDLMTHLQAGRQRAPSEGAVRLQCLQGQPGVSEGAGKSTCSERLIIRVEFPAREGLGRDPGEELAMYRVV